MEKNSVVTSIEPDEAFEYKGETYFKWNVAFENGDSGEVNTKKQQPPWGVGDEGDYTITPAKGPYPDRIKKVWKDRGGASGSGFSGGSKGGGGKSNNRSFALSYAKDLIIAQDIPGEAVDAAHEVCRVADIFIDWLDQ